MSLVTTRGGLILLLLLATLATPAKVVVKDVDTIIYDDYTPVIHNVGGLGRQRRRFRRRRVGWVRFGDVYRTYHHPNYRNLHVDDSRDYCRSSFYSIPTTTQLDTTEYDDEANKFVGRLKI